MLFSINPANLIRALSQALEFSTTGLSKHHLRTALIAERLADHIALTGPERQTLVYASLLHDLGAATNWHEKRRLHETNANAWREVHRHSSEGYRLLKDSPQFGALAEPIRCHHFAWDGNNGGDLAGRDIPLVSRMINIADRIEVQLRDDENIFVQWPDIMTVIRQGAGTYFDPEIVRALHDLAPQESFWLDLTNSYYYYDFCRAMCDFDRVRFTFDDVLNIAGIFATVIDRTSRFTAIHSRGVAEVADLFADREAVAALMAAVYETEGAAAPAAADASSLPPGPET